MENIMKKLSITLLFILAGFVLITESACTKDEKVKDKDNFVLSDDKKDSQVEEVALNGVFEKVNASGINVFKVESVINNGSGKVPDFKFKVGDETMSFFDLIKDKVVFLNFWGTWCPPCRKEIPDIIEIAAELKGKDFIVIGVALERNPASAVESVATYSKTKGLNYVNFVDLQQGVAQAFGGIYAVPTTYIIDKNKNIAQVYQGAATKDVFMNMINQVLLK